MTDRLFDVPELPEADPREQLSAGRRLTLRNLQLLASGQHPATHRPLLDAAQAHTCGDCAHHIVTGHGNRTWHKCERHRLGPSHSAASDIRVSWPACSLFTPTTEETP